RDKLVTGVQTCALPISNTAKSLGTPRRLRWIIANHRGAWPIILGPQGSRANTKTTSNANFPNFKHLPMAEILNLRMSLGPGESARGHLVLCCREFIRRAPSVGQHLRSSASTGAVAQGAIHPEDQLVDRHC